MEKWCSCIPCITLQFCVVRQNFTALYLVAVCCSTLIQSKKSVRCDCPVTDAQSLQAPPVIEHAPIARPVPIALPCGVQAVIKNKKKKNFFARGRIDCDEIRPRTAERYLRFVFFSLWTISTSRTYRAESAQLGSDRYEERKRASTTFTYKTVRPSLRATGVLTPSRK